MSLPQPTQREAAADLRPFTLALLKIELQKALETYKERLLQAEPEPDDIALALQRRIQQAHDDTLATLGRIADGTYGICESCRRLISEERLEAMPTTKHCVTCARVRGGRKPGPKGHRHPSRSTFS